MAKDLETQRALAEAKSEKKIRNTRRKKDDRCGTVAGYFAHRRKKPKERPCKACRKAWSIRMKENEMKRNQNK